MDTEAVRTLQRAVDVCLQEWSIRHTAHGNSPLLERIEMGRGSEVMNLTMNAEVRVHTRDGRMRGFNILAKEFAEWVFAPEREGNPHAPQFDDIYTVGGPLALVCEITGDSIVRAVVRYLELEEGRAGY